MTVTEPGLSRPREGAQDSRPVSSSGDGHSSIQGEEQSWPESQLALPPQPLASSLAHEALGPFIDSDRREDPNPR